ncbi:spore coat protein SP87-like [Mya arenaria]|nr:spore coat protein SP87-like [Mya arenaria]
MHFLAWTLPFVALTGSSGTYIMPPPPTPPPHNGCTVEGHYYSCGTFEDPRDRCSECQCYPENTLKCVKKPCGEPHCGYEMQEPTPDKCCKRCLPECALIDCPVCNCPLEQRYFRPNSCCPECRPEDDSSEEDPKTPYDDVRCRKGSKYYRCGTFEDPEDRCSMCTCYRNGNVKCEKKLCTPLPCGYKRQMQVPGGCCNRCDFNCGRCPRLSCHKQIIPADACCPVCLYDPDSSSSDSGSSDSSGSSNSGSSGSSDTSGSSGSSSVGNSGSSDSNGNSGSSNGGNSGSSDSSGSNNGGSSGSSDSIGNSGNSNGGNSGSSDDGNSGSSDGRNSGSSDSIGNSESSNSGNSGSSDDRDSSSSDDGNSGSSDSIGKSGSSNGGNNGSSDSSGSSNGGNSGSSDDGNSSSSHSGSIPGGSGSSSSSSGEPGCDKDGQHYGIGPFDVPCYTCECFENGETKCEKVPCEEASCGVNKQKNDECGCPVCDESCSEIRCPPLNCPKERMYYEPDSCCQTCQCLFDGNWIPEGSISICLFCPNDLLRFAEIS